MTSDVSIFLRNGEIERAAVVAVRKNSSNLRLLRSLQAGARTS